MGLSPDRPGKPGGVAEPLVVLVEHHHLSRFVLRFVSRFIFRFILRFIFRFTLRFILRFIFNKVCLILRVHIQFRFTFNKLCPIPILFDPIKPSCLILIKCLSLSVIKDSTFTLNSI